MKEILLFDESCEGNFLMCCTQKSLFGREFHVLHISADRALHHIIIARDASTGGFVFADDRVTAADDRHKRQMVKSTFDPFAATLNDLEALRTSETVYKGVGDLLMAQRLYRLSLGADKRSFVEVAVADRGNRRVQVLRMFWEKSDFYQPSATVIHVIDCTAEVEAVQTLHGDEGEEKGGGGEGGRGRRGRRRRARAGKSPLQLVDPVSVAYSPFGELAICDAGARRVYLLSRQWEVVRTISTGFSSDAVLNEKRRAAVKAAAMSKVAAAATGQRDPFDAIDEQTALEKMEKKDSGSAGPKRTRSAVGEVGSSPPWTVAFSHVGELAIGYKNGGSCFLTLLRPTLSLPPSLLLSALTVTLTLFPPPLSSSSPLLLSFRISERGPGI